MAIFRAIQDGNNNDLAIWEIYDGSNWNPADRLPDANFDDDVYLNNKKVELIADMSARLITNMQDDNIDVAGGSATGGYLNLTGSYNINLVGDLVDYGRGYYLHGLLQILANYTGNLYQFGKLDKANNVSGNVVHNESTQGLKIFEGEKLGSTGAIGDYAFRNLGDNVILRGDLVGRYNKQEWSAVCTITPNVQNFIIENGVLSAVSSAFYNLGNNCKFVFKNCVIQQNTGLQGTITNTKVSTELSFENCEFQLYLLSATPQKALLNSGTTTYKNCRWRIGNSELDSQLFFTNDFLDTNTPNETDVRANIIYGVGSDKIGVLAVPPPESVAKNVPTDDTVGSLPIAQTISTDDITEIKQTLEVIDLNVQNIDVDFTPVNNKLDIIENKIDNIEIDVGDVDVDLTPINEKLNGIEEKIDMIIIELDNGNNGGIDVPPETMTDLQQVKAIIQTELTEQQIYPFLHTAEAYVSQRLNNTTLASETVHQIKLWFTAHLIAVTKERISRKEEAGTAKIEYVGIFGAGLNSTPYGQVCISLDTTGELAKENKQVIKLTVPTRK